LTIAAYDDYFWLLDLDELIADFYLMCPGCILDSESELKKLLSVPD